MHYELIRETFPKARKQHQCIWCGESILVGEKHRHEVSRYDGLQNHRWHLECVDQPDWTYDDCFIPYENERPSSALRRLPEHE